MEKLPATVEDFFSAVRHTMTTVGGIGMGTSGSSSEQFYVALGLTVIGYVWSYMKNRSAAK